MYYLFEMLIIDINIDLLTIILYYYRDYIQIH